MSSLLYVLLSMICVVIADYPLPQLDQLATEIPEWTANFNYRNAQPVAPIIQCPTSGTWAFTSDDGPSNDTIRLLDALKSQNLKTTFFVVGSRIVERPQVLRRIYEEGHQIGVHTWSHPDLATLTAGQIIAEIMHTINLIKSITGQVPTCMRPPYGSTNDLVLRVMNAMNLQVIIWNVDVQDYANTDPQQTISAYQTVIKTPPSGPISLSHDLKAVQVDASLTVLQNIRQSGFRVVTIGECLQLPFYMVANKPTIQPVPTPQSSKPSNDEKPSPHLKSAASHSYPWLFLLLILAQ